MGAQVDGGEGQAQHRWPSADTWRTLGIDVVTGAAVFGLWLAATELGRSNGWRPTAPDLWVLAGACLGVAVAVRRVAPMWLLVALVLAYPVGYAHPLASDFHLLPVLVLGYAGAQRTARRPWAIVGASAIAVLVFFSPFVEQQPFFATAPPGGLRDQWRPNWSDLALAGFATVSVALLGAAIGAQRAAARDLADRNEELERLRRSDAERAVAEERLRISREVHDVVAHHLTAILMRAQAADRVADADPQAASDAVSWIANESREALRSTRVTVSSLRGTDTPSGGTQIGPLADDLAQIVERVRQVGLPARLSIEGSEPSLAPAAGLAVRRTVQEALTNVLKHAHATAALVRVRTEDEGLDVRIVDDGSADAQIGALRSSGSQGGAGLAGMQERAAACGGRLRFGAVEGGGWQVHLWVPTLVQGAR